MTDEYFGTIAALEFCAPPKQSFEDIVEELDVSFRPVGLTRRSLIWDGDDIAIIERDALRLLLSWAPPLVEGGRCHLVVSVGQRPRCPRVVVGRETCEYVRDILLSHLKSYLSVSTIRITEAKKPISTELVDTMIEILIKVPARPTGENVRSMRDYQKTREPQQMPTDVPLQDSEPEEVLEADFKDLPEIEPNSLPKRLTIYTLGATMLIYTPPVGASLLAYSALRDLASPSPTPKRSGSAA